MPRVNIWLSADLHQQVKAAGVPVSEVCQLALKRELAALRRRTPPDPIPGQLRIDDNRRQ